METLKFVRAEDHPKSGIVVPGGIDASSLCGSWVNTNNETRGIQRVVLREIDGDLHVRVTAAGPSGPIEWGEIKVASVYATDSGSRNAGAFEAHYDFGFMKALLQANLSLGLLVVAGLNTFEDESHRSNYFSREFYYRAD